MLILYQEVLQRIFQPTSLYHAFYNNLNHYLRLVYFQTHNCETLFQTIGLSISLFNSSTEPLSSCHCRCKGQLARVHRSCLVEWVRYKGSNRCEICGGIFRSVPNPVLGVGVNQLDVGESLGLILEVCCRRRRRCCY